MSTSMRSPWLLLIVAVCLICLFSPTAVAGAQGGRRAPKVGIALSGGGARGAAHIGVLKALEREGIPVDYIAGTSFGALVGGFYAVGYSAQEIATIFTSQDWDNLFSDSPNRRFAPLIQRKNFRYLGELAFRDFQIDLPTALYGGQKLIEILNFYTTPGILAANYDFDRLKIPFRAVATDLLTGKPYVFRAGRMSEALRASSAMPPVFTPVEKDDMLLVDGGLVNDLPADIVREMGADIVIAVDVTTPLLKKEEIRNFVDVVDQALSLQMKESVVANSRFADLVICPDLAGFTYGSYAQVTEIAARGEKAAQKLTNELRGLVGNVPRSTSALDQPARAKQIIESITFQGLTREEGSQLLNEVESRPNEELDMKELRDDLSRLYATRQFDRVDFYLEPTGQDRYRLHYLVKESAAHSLGVSMRYDRDYDFVALAEFNMRRMFNSPSTATFSSQFGGLENHAASLRLIHSRIPFLFVEPQVHVRKRERLDLRDTDLVDKFTDKRRGGQFMVGGTFGKRLELSAGYRFDRTRIVGGSEPHRQSGFRNLAGLRLRLNRDTLDDQEYPNSGMQVNFQIDKPSAGLGSDFSYSLWQGDVQHFFTLSKKSALRVHASAAISNGVLPFYERAYIGGFTFSDGGSRQLLGYARDELAGRQAVLWGVSYRHQILSQPLRFARRGFLYFHYNLGGVSDRESRPYNFNLFNGVGAGVQLDTIVGPVRLVGGWGEAGRAIFYLSVGPAF